MNYFWYCHTIIITKQNIVIIIINFYKITDEITVMNNAIK